MAKINGNPVFQLANEGRLGCASSPSASRSASILRSLGVIVTGFEHSGTTVLSQLVMSAPRHFGGFECGLLLACTPREFANVTPFHSWLPSLWQLTAGALEQIEGARNFTDAYATLRYASLCLRRANATMVIDKTPGYIYALDQVMRLAPGVPVLVAIKDRVAQLASFAKHNPPGWRTHPARYEAGEAALGRALVAFPKRIRMVNMTELDKCAALRSGSAADLSSAECVAASETMVSAYRWLRNFGEDGTAWDSWDPGHLTLATGMAKARLCYGKNSSILAAYPSIKGQQAAQNKSRT